MISARVSSGFTGRAILAEIASGSATGIFDRGQDVGHGVSCHTSNSEG